jgi:hypothetical protein
MLWVVLGQDSAALTVELSVSKAPDTTEIADGKKAKASGIVINRNGDTFITRDSNGTETLR